MNVNETQALGVLSDALQVVSQWETLTSTNSGAWQATANSDLADDDSVTHPRDVSPAPWAALSAAVSHLGCLRDAVFGTRGPNQVPPLLHTHGQLTLVRGALENASMAVWLLEPDQREERVLRRLRQDWAELRQLDVVATTIGTSPARTLDVHFQELSAIAGRVGGDPTKIKQRPEYGDVVKAAGSHVPSGPTTAFVVWKACSSIAHGELRGMIAYLKHETISSPTPGMRLNRVTGNVELLVTGGLMAVETARTALGLYKRRADSPIIP